MTRKVLVADDEKKIVELVAAYLKSAGFSVVPASSGREALEGWRRECPDCLILDINMGEGDGLDTAREIRKTSDVPIIFLTARVDETDRVVGLELGADDYVLKPFSPRELLARVKAVLRRFPARREEREASPSLLRCGGVTVDPAKHAVTVDRREVAFTKAQFDILRLLMSEPGRVFSRMEILESALKNDLECYERTVDAHIKNIRKLLGDDGESPRYIGTVRGVGYRFIEG